MQTPPPAEINLNVPSCPTGRRRALIAAPRHPRCPGSRAGYTIVEVCLVLFIIALIAGAIIPFTGGFMTEQQLREPARQIELLARTARHLATLQQRPYVIILNSDHLVLQPYNPAAPTEPFQAPDSTHDPLTTQNQTLTTTTHSTAVQSSTTSADDTPVYSRQDAVEQEYLISKSIVLTVRGWQEKDWYTPQNRTWIFPPTGLCEPLEIHIQKGDAYIENTYDALTGSVKSERFLIP